MRAVVLHHAPVVLEGLAELVQEAAPAAHVVRAANPEACREAMAHDPEGLLVLDATTGAPPVLGLCRELSATGATVVALVDSEAGGYLDVVSAGASALVLVDVDGRQGLLEALVRVIGGEVHLPPVLLGSLLRSLVERDRAVRAATPLQRLSPRELEVLALVASDHDDREIATALQISPHTAKTHVTRVLGKLGVPNRTEAARIARAEGLLCSAAGGDS